MIKCSCLACIEGFGKCSRSITTICKHCGEKEIIYDRGMCWRCIVEIKDLKE